MNTEHVHRDDVPIDINAVIIDNVLNGSDIRPPPSASHASYQWGHVHFINSAVFDSHDYRPMLNSVGTSTPAHPPHRHDADTSHEASLL